MDGRCEILPVLSLPSTHTLSVNFITQDGNASSAGGSDHLEIQDVHPLVFVGDTQHE